MQALIGLFVASLMALPLVADASPRRTGVYQDRVIDNRLDPSAPTALTSVSRTLYINDCLPNGCTVTPGFDNSKTNRSSIANTTTTLTAYGWGADHWALLMNCVRDTF